MTLGDRTYRYIRHTFGTLSHKNIYSTSFGYTETRKKVAAGTTTAVHAAISGSTSSQTVTTGITNPDVPRCLRVTVGGTVTDAQAGTITITGTNVEGKTITEGFSFNEDVSAGDLNGTKAFKTVTQIVVPPQLGTAITFSVGTRNLLGINHRLFKNNTTVKVFSSTTVNNPTVLTLQTAPTIVADADDIENNTVTPATTPDGTTFLTIAYVFDNWATAPVNDEPEYSTTTSTSSTSSSTSTTTITTSTSSSSTSSSSTSSSISTSSTSSTSSSISTSSTSSSTTTVP